MSSLRIFLPRGRSTLFDTPAKLHTEQMGRSLLVAPVSYLPGRLPALPSVNQRTSYGISGAADRSAPTPSQSWSYPAARPASPCARAAGNVTAVPQCVRGSYLIDQVRVLGAALLAKVLDLHAVYATQRATMAGWMESKQPTQAHALTKNWQACASCVCLWLCTSACGLGCACDSTSSRGDENRDNRPNQRTPPFDRHPIGTRICTRADASFGALPAELSARASCRTCPRPPRARSLD
jgi:hypothetical protein